MTTLQVIVPRKKKINTKLSFIQEIEKVIRISPSESLNYATLVDKIKQESRMLLKLLNVIETEIRLFDILLPALIPIHLIYVTDTLSMLGNEKGGSKNFHRVISEIIHINLTGEDSVHSILDKIAKKPKNQMSNEIKLHLPQILDIINKARINSTYKSVKPNK